VVSLQSRLQFGAVFVSDKYGTLREPCAWAHQHGKPGERPRPRHHRQLQLRRTRRRGRPGLEISYASSVNRRGDHGSFSRTDTHISMMAHGPDFKSGMYDTLSNGKRRYRADGRAHSRA